MWPVLFGLFFFVSGVLLIIWMISRAQEAQAVRDRLIEQDEDAEALLSAARQSSVMRRYRWIVVLMGGLALVAMLLFAFWPWPYSLAMSVMMTLLLWQTEQWWSQRKINRTEQQLADSIDLMCAAVKSGSSLQGAIESAMQNTANPWRGELGILTGRIRYGDDPNEVFAGLSERIPLETVRLFSQTLAVNWSVGGRLSHSLANVGKTIRDRLELSRRMQAMTTQARLSVISVIMVTYFIGVLMWRNDPERMEDYLVSLVGQSLVATAMILQAVGVLWISRLSTPRF